MREQWGRGACAAAIEWVEVRVLLTILQRAAPSSWQRSTQLKMSGVARLGNPEDNVRTYANGETGLGRPVPLSPRYTPSHPPHRVWTDILWAQEQAH